MLWLYGNSTGGLSPNGGQNIGDKVSAMAAKSCQNIVDKESAAIAKSLDITLSGGKPKIDGIIGFLAQ